MNRPLSPLFWGKHRGMSTTWGISVLTCSARSYATCKRSYPRLLAVRDSIGRWRGTGENLPGRLVRSLKVAECVAGTGAGREPRRTPYRSMHRRNGHGVGQRIDIGLSDFQRGLKWTRKARLRRTCASPTQFRTAASRSRRRSGGWIYSRNANAEFCYFSQLLRPIGQSHARWVSASVRSRLMWGRLWQSWPWAPALERQSSRMCGSTEFTAVLRTPKVSKGCEESVSERLRHGSTGPHHVPSAAAAT